MPRAKRVAWVVVVTVAILMATMAATPTMQLLLYRYDAHVASDPTGSGGWFLYYEGCRFNRWTGQRLPPELRLLWGPPGHGVVEPHVLSLDDGQSFRTFYSPTGMPCRQDDDDGVVETPPWPHPIPYTPDEMSTRIHNAQLFVQQAAADGKIVLPDWWEAVE